MKLFNYWYLSLVLLLSLGSHSCAQNKVTIDIKEDEQLIEFTTDRFTLPNLHVTPDGESIIFDVLGDIYLVPIEGGKAEVLLQDNNWKRGAKLSPDGKTLAYVSDETGVFQVWTYNLNTHHKHVYDVEEFHHYPLYPYWSAKGQLLIPSKEGLRGYIPGKDIYNVIREPKEDEYNTMHTINRRLTIGKSGRQAYYYKNQSLWRYDLENHSDSIVIKWIDDRVLHKHLISEKGSSILFYKNNDSIWNKFDLIYLNLKNGEEKIIQTKNSLGFSTNLNYSYDFINDSTIILNKEGEIIRMDIESGEYDPIPVEVEVKKIIKKPLRRKPQYIKDSIITANVLRNPVTRDGMDTIYFGAFGKLRSYAESTGQITEIYSEEDRFEVSPSLSPNGNYLAYTTWNDVDMGHLYARELSSGKEYQLTKAAGRYINPGWSPDGTEIIFVADETEAKMGIPRQSGGTNTYNYHLDLHRIKLFENNKIQKHLKSDIIHKVYPFSIMPRRFYPIPTFHQNGESVFITTRNHEKDLPVLIQVDLETKEVIQERLIPFHTDEVVVSPDSQSIAFILDEQVWIDSFPYSLKYEFNKDSELAPTNRLYKGGVIDNILLSEAKSIYEVAPSYLSWQDENTLMWGSAEEVYTYDIRAEKTEKIVDIKVQKLRASPKTEYALINARIITMNKNDSIIEKGTILVKDNRIEIIGGTEEIIIPDNYKVYNLEGKTIIPGLIDVHAHYLLEPYEIINQKNYKLIGNLAYGVTTIYDPSVNVLDYREQAQMVEIGQVLGSRIFASGNLIMNFPQLYDYNSIKNVSDGDIIIGSMNKLNVFGPIKEYDKRNRHERKNLVKSSFRQNKTITAHQTNLIEGLSRIIDGYTAIEHYLGSFKVYDDVIKLISESKINYTPTIIVTPRIGDVYLEETKLEKNKLINLNGESLYLKRLGSRYIQKRPDSLSKSNEKLRYASNTLKKIIDYGGKVSIGGHGNPLPGIGTHWELWSHTYDDGLSNYHALQAATITGAEKLDLQEEIGSIEEGKLADLVILNSNPLESIFNTTDIKYVIINGAFYKVEAFYKI